MAAKILSLLLLMGSLPALLWAQGGSCTQYHTWTLSGCSSVDPSEETTAYWMSLVELGQEQYGGVGPNCSYKWLGANWYGDCYSTAWTCDPPSPPVSGCSNPDACAGEPISLANGNVSIQETDMQLPGLGGGLSLTRTWNSTWPCYFLCSPPQGLFGAGWRSTYEESLSVGPNGTMTYSRSDGSMWSFAAIGNPNSGNPPVFQLIAPTNVPPVKLAEQGVTSSPTWTLTFENGEQRVFNGLGGGPLSAIIDRNGNTTTLTYTPTTYGSLTVNQLTTITDPAGRHLNFTYGSPTNNLVVSNVASDPGTGLNVTYTYAMDQYEDQLYGNSVLLTKVTQSDGTFVTFSYDQDSRGITSVNDTNGKLLESHVYADDGCNAGASSARANGVDALTIVFPNMSSYCSPGGVGYPLAQ